VYRLPVIEAIRLTGATCKASGLYQRLSRLRAREAAEEELAVAEYDAAAAALVCLGGATKPTPKKRTPTAASSSKAAMIDEALDALPEWCDRDGTRKSMTRHQRKNLTQAHLSRLTCQVEKRYYSARYSAGYKAATLAMQSTADSKQYGTGLRATVNRINKEMLHSPNDKKLTKSTIYNAVARGDFGISPLKNGRKGVIPPELTHGLACHSVMMQASGEGEASSLKMRAISSAVTLGTKFENTFSTDYLWRKTRLDHPRLIMPAKAIDNEDRRVDWLTYKNINDWNTRAKSFLVSIGMGTEDPGLIRKCFVCFIFCQHVTHSICSFECLFHFRRRREQDGSRP
jgi:hypothetical protein